MSEMRQVSRDEFYKALGALDVHPHIQPPERYPYRSVWELRQSRQTMGETVGRDENGKLLTDYFLPAPAGSEGKEERP